MLRSVVFLWVFCLRMARPELIPFELILEANSDEIHYFPLWLEGPAVIDMTEVSFVTSTRIFDDDMWVNDDDGEGGDDSTGESPGTATSTPHAVPSQHPWAKPHAVPSQHPWAKPHAVPSQHPWARPHAVPSQHPLAAPHTPTAKPSPVPGSGGGPIPTVTAPIATTTVMPSSAPGDGGSVSLAPTGQVATVATPAPSPANRRQKVRILDQGGSAAAGKGAQKTKQVIDLVFFRAPDDCKRNKWGGCDWALLGVGIRDEWMPGGVGYCCSEDAVSNGSCSSDELGRVLINHSIFTGEHKEVEVPSENNQVFKIDDPIFQATITGDYILLLANCFDPGMDVFTMGSMSTQTGKGYNLPGELYDLMYFYVCMTLLYFLIILWYWCGMQMFQEASIPIQRFILTTLILGLLEFFFRALDLGVWNIEGLRSGAIIWSAVVIGVLRRGITRCLFVMVSMGWGVIRDTLGLALFKIVFLGLLYCALTMLRDFLVVLAVDKVESWSSGAEAELLDLTFLVTLAVVAINLIFFFWIISSLSATTDYLKNMNQTTKLRRHLRLRCIIVTGFIMAIVWFVFSIMDGALKILTTNQYWLMEGAMHVNNLLVIGSVAFLWRPNANSKDYAMQMQLATGDDAENELELSCVVPSAEDMDDGNDPDHRRGLPVDDAVVT